MRICRTCGATKNDSLVETCCDQPDIIDAIELDDTLFSDLKKAKETTKDAKKKEDELVAKIKSAYAKYGIKKVLSSVATISVSTTSSPTLDEDMLMQKLKMILTEDDIETYQPFTTIEKLDPKALQELVKVGLVPVTLVQECTKYGNPVSKCTVNAPKTGGPAI